MVFTATDNQGTVHTMPCYRACCEQQHARLQARDGSAGAMAQKHIGKTALQVFTVSAKR
jgi:hypothetical protein